MAENMDPPNIGMFKYCTNLYHHGSLCFLPKFKHLKINFNWDDISCWFGLPVKLFLRNLELRFGWQIKVSIHSSRSWIRFSEMKGKFKRNLGRENIGRVNGNGLSIICL
jgi:hypothetical protein